LNGLLLNPSKSSIAYFGTRRRVHDTALPTSRPITVAGSDVDTADSLHISWE